MTNNKVYVNQDGNETVQVNRADGLGISEIKKIGIQQIIISTETNPVVSTRASKLEIICLQGIENKKIALINYCNDNNFNLKNVAYVGNDINDREVMEVVGMRFCPNDAHYSIKNISDHILETKGGDGVIRELLDFIN
tara:strand:- start:187 stop:600 length:414 start_codon:yes stop_codon:yes gene_type:complete